MAVPRIHRGVNPQELTLSGENSQDAEVLVPTTRKPAPNVETPPETLYHIVLSVTDEGTPPLTRYRRVLLNVPTAGTSAARDLGCEPPAGAGR